MFFTQAIHGVAMKFPEWLYCTT